jgi:hypothetical protein
MVPKRKAESGGESAPSDHDDDVVAPPQNKKAKRLNRRKAKAEEQAELMTSDFFDLEVHFQARIMGTGPPNVPPEAIFVQF